MKKLLLLIACTAMPVAMRAQESLFQDSDGATSLYTQRPTATLNFGDSKASLAYSKHDNQSSVVWGYEVFATANSGVVSLFESDKPKAPAGGGDFTIGRHFDFKPGTPPPPPFVMVPGKRYDVLVPPEREKWWLIDIGYSRSSFYVSPTAVPASQADTNFDRYRALGVLDLSWNGSNILGFAGGIERRNNTADLKAAQFQTIVAPAPAGSSSDIVTTKTGFFGNYQTYVAVPFYADWLWYVPKAKIPGFGNTIGLDTFVRTDLGNANRSAKGGLGFYFFKKGDSLTPIGGVTVSYDGSKVQAGVTTSFNLSK